MSGRRIQISFTRNLRNMKSDASQRSVLRMSRSANYDSSPSRSSAHTRNVQEEDHYIIFETQDYRYRRTATCANANTGFKSPGYTAGLGWQVIPSCMN